LHGRYGAWDEEERWSRIDPSPKIYRGRKTFFHQLSESRLSVSTYNSTTFLETFVANFPTVIFWNPKYFELRNSAKPYHDDLRKAGILHDTPESAAAKVNEIFENPMAWWMSTETQASKDRFCHRFARTSDDWVAKWKGELLKIADGIRA
jgi:putative transferase (TIGR04331 family)